MDLVSVILPFFNARLYLDQAISSVISQSHYNLELILVNDGSLDESRSVAMKYIKDNRIRYIEQENQGVSSARNAGLEIMRGKFFCFLDSDDILPTKSLESRALILESDKDIHFVDGKVIKWDSTLEEKTGIWRPNYRGPVKECLCKLNEDCFFGNTWMIRNTGQRYRFREDITHGEDLLFYIEISEEGLYDYTEEEVLYYRDSPSSAMKDFEGLQEGYSKIYRIVKDMEGVSEHAKESMRKRIRRILCLSYLRQGRPGKAAVTWVEYSPY